MWLWEPFWDILSCWLDLLIGRWPTELPEATTRQVTVTESFPACSVSGPLDLKIKERTYSNSVDNHVSIHGALKLGSERMRAGCNAPHRHYFYGTNSNMKFKETHEILGVSSIPEEELQSVRDICTSESESIRSDWLHLQGV